jgi:hypothetical protein
MKSSSRTPSSVELLLRDEEEKREATTRYQDLVLAFRRRRTGEFLLKCGGRWDNLTRTYLPGGVLKATQVKIIDLEESQVEFTRWYAGWLEAYTNGDPRDVRLVLTAGERRGGKTTIGLLSTIAAAISRPNTITWVISSTFQERDEIENAIRKFIPSSWTVYKGAPRYRFIFPNGSVLRCLSADDPETLKQGQVDLVLANEAQKMPAAMLTNAIPGVIDRGGLVILAANPPRREIGAWVRDLKEAIDGGKLPASKFFGFSAKLNEQIDQKAREDVGAILRVVDERAAKADDEGLWLPIGDVAYPKFLTTEHVRPVPEIGNITRDVLKRRLGRPRDHLATVDFQINPYNASVILEVFRGPQGENLYWATREYLIPGSEDEMIDAVESSGIFTPENTVWIGDASGTWQDAAHRTGRHSYEVFRARRWEIHPPRKAKNEDRKPSNPPVQDRISLVNNLLTAGRLFVDPKGCPRLALALKKCQIKHDKPHGVFAHVTDALGYGLYWLEPKPTQRGAAPIGAWNVNITRGNGF